MRSGRIQDIDELLTDYICFEGMIDKDDRQIGGCMDKAGFLTTGAGTLGKLFLRLFRKHKQYEGQVYISDAEFSEFYCLRRCSPAVIPAA